MPAILRRTMMVTKPQRMVIFTLLKVLWLLATRQHCAPPVVGYGCCRQPTSTSATTSILSYYVLLLPHLSLSLFVQDYRNWVFENEVAKCSSRSTHRRSSETASYAAKPLLEREIKEFFINISYTLLSYST